MFTTMPCHWIPRHVAYHASPRHVKAFVTLMPGGCEITADATPENGLICSGNENYARSCCPFDHAAGLKEVPKIRLLVVVWALVKRHQTDLKNGDRKTDFDTSRHHAGLVVNSLCASAVRAPESGNIRSKDRDSGDPQGIIHSPHIRQVL